METVLGLPHALVAGHEPQRDAVTEQLAVKQADDEADPVDKGNCDEWRLVNWLTAGG